MYERAASGGLGAVLDIARHRGMLGADDTDMAGRMYDQKGAGMHAYDDGDDDGEGGGGGGGGRGGGPSFKLEYHDEYGRKMTQKQAFRELSWKFHGKGPSKKNREKRMLEVEKQRQERAGDKGMRSISALQAAQQATKSAHVVLSGAHQIKQSELAGPDRKKPKRGL